MSLKMYVCVQYCNLLIENWPFQNHIKKKLFRKQMISVSVSEHFPHHQKSKWILELFV